MPRSLIENYRETAKDIIRANLLQRRRLQDPAVLREQYINVVGLEPAVAEQLADLYLERNAYPVNGALNHENVQLSVDFLQANEILAPGLKPEDVADWSLLEEVLDDIGRE